MDDMARPFKPTSTESHDWDTRADQAQTAAEDLPDGPERAEALRKAELLRAGANMRRALRTPQS